VSLIIKKIYKYINTIKIVMYNVKNWSVNLPEENGLLWVRLATYSFFIYFFLEKKKVKLMSSHYQITFFIFFSQKIHNSFLFYITSINSYCSFKRKSNFFFLISKQFSLLFSYLYHINQFLLIFKNKKQKIEWFAIRTQCFSLF